MTDPDPTSPAPPAARPTDAAAAAAAAPAAPVARRPRAGLLKLLARGYAAAPIAFSIAVVIHALGLAAAVYYYGVVRPAQEAAVPTVATEPAGPRTPPVSFLPPPPAGIADDPDRQSFRALLGDPASEFPPPDLAPLDPALDPSQGATAIVPLPALAGDPPTAPITAHPLPTEP